MIIRLMNYKFCINIEHQLSEFEMAQILQNLLKIYHIINFARRRDAQLDSLERKCRIQ
jgi:hypothetical protein